MCQFLFIFNFWAMAISYNLCLVFLIHFLIWIIRRIILTFLNLFWIFMLNAARKRFSFQLNMCVWWFRLAFRRILFLNKIYKCLARTICMIILMILNSLIFLIIIAVLVEIWININKWILLFYIGYECWIYYWWVINFAFYSILFLHLVLYVIL